MQLSRYLAARRRQIESELSRQLNALTAPSTLRRAMRYSLLAGGKRLRPVLCLAAAEACGAAAKVALPYACALEFVHTYSLIHDDLPAMDDDTLRRGRPTNHVIFGDAMAILAGDALLTEAFHLIGRHALRDGVPSRAALAIVTELAAAAGACGMVAGQADDIKAEHRRLSQRQIEQLHRRKTGCLIRAAVRIGAIAADGDSAQLRRLTTYGECLGLAFQIADDILDEVGSPASTGKVQGRDRVREKPTFVAMLGSSAARQRANHLIARATTALRAFDTDADPLRRLAHYVIERVDSAGAA